jgi:hypothetical protein
MEIENREKLLEPIRNIPKTLSLETFLDYFYQNPYINTAVVQDNNVNILGIVTRNGLLKFLSEKVKFNFSVNTFSGNCYRGCLAR